ncbi:PA14 domain-containing protein [Hymenobacter negativus]|uniref:OmpA family protein n=1 Tax=Hymenobacter negativus TaxID=2795026 RepID=A0ABS3Q9X9_9BACT|nr:PA14 domain-containing protein [Hymenobacter negativus]MBO2007833.1 OmpA family protein [Hymenobacter negativus]
MKWPLPLLLSIWLAALAWQPLAAQPATSPVGDGLQGDYYEGRNFEHFRLRQVDAVIDFKLRQESPAEGVPVNDYSARWTGWLRPPASGHYVLYITVDDGARLWLDGRQLLDEWRGQPPQTYKVDVDLRAGHAYALRFDYCQYGSYSCGWLGWVQPAQLARADSSASSWRTLWGLTASQPHASTIPTRYLFSHNPAVPIAPPVTPGPKVAPMASPRKATSSLLPTVAVRRPPPRPTAVPALSRPRLVPAVPPVVVAPLAAVAGPPVGLMNQLGSGQAVTLRALYFAQGKADLLPSSAACLDTLATVLAQTPALRLQVQGHTDNQGDSTLNRRLSQQRAEAVRRYLVNHGIASDRLQAVGFGGTRPVADNQVPGLRVHNRRVVLQPLP